MRQLAVSSISLGSIVLIIFVICVIHRRLGFPDVLSLGVYVRLLWMFVN